MYTLEKVKNEYRKVCCDAGAKSVLDVPIVLNGRLTRTLGRVIQEYDFSKDRYVSTKVEFSRQLIETATDKSIHDVIMHEAAHYIVTDRTGEVHGHDAVFKAVCAEIGTSNNQCATKVECTEEAKNLYKYSIYCPHCGKMVGGYSRMCKTIRNIEDYECKTCHGSLKVIQNW